jgi:hypothetical protein
MVMTVPVVMMVMVMIIGVSVLMGMTMRVAALMVMNMMGTIMALESRMAVVRVSHRSECQRRAAPAARQAAKGAYLDSWFDSA